MNAKWIFTSALVLVLHSSAFGQSYVLQDGSAAGDSFQNPSYGSGYGGNGGYGGSPGTFEGSVLYGLGAFARGVGEYNYYTGMAVREMEGARTVAIKNHKSAVESWHTLRKAHWDRRAAEWEKEKLTPAEVAHVVKVSRPDRLTPAQYEPATGKITWRTARDAGPDSAFYDQVRQLTERMLTKLRRNNEQGGKLTPMQFIAGKKILVGLRYESHTPTDAKVLAASE
jgi:hypothetical protein